MDRAKIIKTFSVLGESMVKWGEKASYEAFNPYIAELFHERAEGTISVLKAFNGWFTEESVRQSLYNFGTILTEEKLQEWVKEYPLVKSPKLVGLILPGNIPMVGFHDVLTTIFSGNKARIKLSSDDNKLIPLLLDVVVALQPELKNQFEIVERLNDAEAIIATGSDNTALYFEKYFGHLPNIIRKNRTSVAVLNGNESEEELKALGKDIFYYFGLGCRNVSHLLLPKDYDLNKIFGAIVGYGDVINHHKYCNNYDYYKAIYLMNQEVIIENGFVIFRETKELFAPVAVLHYHFYEEKDEVEEYLKEHQDKIQVVIGKDYSPFGEAQYPQLNDYADNVDTMEFLTSL